MDSFLTYEDLKVVIYFTKEYGKYGPMNDIFLTKFQFELLNTFLKKAYHINEYGYMVHLDLSMTEQDIYREKEICLN